MNRILTLFRRRLQIPSNTYATWNPLDKSANIGLVNGNLSMGHTGPSWHSGRATQGKQTGKWYFEVSIIATAAYVVLGVATPSATLESHAGIDAYGFGYFGLNGNKIYNASLSAYGAAYTDGDVIGIAVDADAMTLQFFKNGSAQGSIDISALSGNDLLPIASLYYTDVSAQITANFGATPFSYSVPVGYNAGWYV